MDRLTARMSGGYGGGDEHPKPAMKRIGYFGEGGYMTIGEPYKTKVKESMPRYEGAQFQTNPTIVCDRFKLRNGQFSKAPPFSVGEPYVTLDQIHKREALKQKKLMVSDTPFRPTNPPKSQVGNLGSNFGTVGYSNKNTPAFPEGGRVPYVPQGAGDERKKKGEVVGEPANIVTNPMKKGSFGYMGTTLGVPNLGAEKRAWKGVVGEYAYVPDPYDAARLAEKEWKKKQKGPISDTPFRPANPGKRGGPGMWGGHRALAGHPKDCGGAISEFHPYVPSGMDPKKTKAEVERDRWKDPYDRVAFRPAKGPTKGGPGMWGCGKKGGGSGTINAFPEATADPYDMLRYKLLDEKKAKRESLGALSDRAAFSSASFGRSKCTPSIFTMNIRV